MIFDHERSIVFSNWPNLVDNKENLNEYHDVYLCWSVKQQTIRYPRDFFLGKEYYLMQRLGITGRIRALSKVRYN